MFKSEKFKNLCDWIFIKFICIFRVGLPLEFKNTI